MEFYFYFVRLQKSTVPMSFRHACPVSYLFLQMWTDWAFLPESPIQHNEIPVFLPLKRDPTGMTAEK